MTCTLQHNKNLFFSYHSLLRTWGQSTRSAMMHLAWSSEGEGTNTGNLLGLESLTFWLATHSLNHWTTTSPRKVTQVMALLGCLVPPLVFSSYLDWMFTHRQKWTIAPIHWQLSNLKPYHKFLEPELVYLTQCTRKTASRVISIWIPRLGDWWNDVP